MGKVAVLSCDGEIYGSPCFEVAVSDGGLIYHVKLNGTELPGVTGFDVCARMGEVTQVSVHFAPCEVDGVVLPRVLELLQQGQKKVSIRIDPKEEPEERTCEHKWGPWAPWRGEDDSQESERMCLCCGATECVGAFRSVAMAKTPAEVAKEMEGR